MKDWSCRDCHGRGMFYDEERKRVILCGCPKGKLKKHWLDMSPEERETERQERERRQKRGKKEKVPF